MAKKVEAHGLPNGTVKVRILHGSQIHASVVLDAEEANDLAYQLECAIEDAHRPPKKAAKIGGSSPVGLVAAANAAKEAKEAKAAYDALQAPAVKAAMDAALAAVNTAPEAKPSDPPAPSENDTPTGVVPLAIVKTDVTPLPEPPSAAKPSKPVGKSKPKGR